MIKKTINILLILAIGYCAYFLYSSKGTVVISFENYEVSSSFVSLVAILIVLLIPTYLLIKINSYIRNRLRYMSYRNSINQVINNISLPAEKEFVMEVIEKKASTSELRAIIAIQKQLSGKNPETVLALCSKLKEKNKKIAKIIDFYVCNIHELNKDSKSFVTECKKAILNYKENSWFFEKVSLSILKENTLNDLLMLEKLMKNVKFASRTQKEKLTCLISYKISNLLLEKDLKLCKERCEKLIRNNKHFEPAYNTMIKIMIKENSPNQEINNLLLEAWDKSPSYYIIQSFLKFFTPENLDNIEAELSTFFNKSYKDLNNLLVANMLIKYNKLIEASEALELVKDSQYKSLTEIILAAKQKDFNKLRKLISANYRNHIQDSWWHNYNIS